MSFSIKRRSFFLLLKSMLCSIISISMEQSIGRRLQESSGKIRTIRPPKRICATPFIRLTSYWEENGLLLPTGLCYRLIPSVRLKAMWNFSRTIQRSICRSIRVIFCRVSISRTVKPLTIGCPRCGRDMSSSISRLVTKSWKKIHRIWRNQREICVV